MPTKKPEATAEAVIGVGLTVAALLVLLYCVEGFVLRTLWGWFITPTFRAAPTLSIPAAIGLSITVNFLTQPAFKDRGKEGWQALLYGLASWVMTLVIGYIVHSFM